MRRPIETESRDPFVRVVNIRSCLREEESWRNVKSRISMRANSQNRNSKTGLRCQRKFPKEEKKKEEQEAQREEHDEREREREKKTNAARTISGRGKFLLSRRVSRRGDEKDERTEDGSASIHRWFR